MLSKQKLILPGGAGHVGKNLVTHLKRRGCQNIVVLDKDKTNLNALGTLHPDIILECADLSVAGHWQAHFKGASSVVMLQAQIGGIDRAQFQRNNLISTQNVINACRAHNVSYIVHVSSSAVKSKAADDYARTKRQQEQVVKRAGIACAVLRPTLMFGLYDRKHLGWLSKFMKRVPIFPIPGNGRYIRQPLYVVDFCQIIIRCLETRISGKDYDISGLEKINYVDIISYLKKNNNSKTVIMKIPYRLFEFLLRIWSLFDHDPPFTADQLKAMTGYDEFEVIDWPQVFMVSPTPLIQALQETFSHIASSLDSSHGYRINNS